MMAPMYCVSKCCAHDDGGRAVRRADDGDGGRVLQGKAQQGRASDSVKKMPNWAAAPQRIILGLESSGANVDHRADADEEQKREKFRGDARIIEYLAAP